MALIMKYEAETGNDAFNPLTIANAIVISKAFTEAELREIADVLYAHTRTIRDNQAMRDTNNCIF